MLLGEFMSHERKVKYKKSEELRSEAITKRIFRFKEDTKVR